MSFLEHFHHHEEPSEEKEQHPNYEYEGPYNLESRDPYVLELIREYEERGWHPQWVEREDDHHQMRWYIRIEKPQENPQIGLNIGDFYSKMKKIQGVQLSGPEESLTVKSIPQYYDSARLTG